MNGAGPGPGSLAGFARTQGVYGGARGQSFLVGGRAPAFTTAAPGGGHLFAPGGGGPGQNGMFAGGPSLASGHPQPRWRGRSDALPLVFTVEKFARTGLWEARTLVFDTSMQQLVVLKRGQVSKKYGFMELLGFQQADERHFSVTVGQSHFWQINVMYLDDVRPFAATLELVLGYRNLASGQVPSGPQDLHALADRIACLGAPRTAYQAGQVRLVEAAGTKLSNVWIAAIPGRVLVYKSRSASYPIQAFPVGTSLQQVAEMGEYEQYYAALNFFGNKSNGAMMYPHLEAAVDWVLLHTFDFQSMREWAQVLKEDKERPPETPAKGTLPVPPQPSRPPPAAAVSPPETGDGGRFSFAALPAPPAEAEPAVQGTSPAAAEAPGGSDPEDGSSWTGSEWGSSGS